MALPRPTFAQSLQLAVALVAAFLAFALFQAFRVPETGLGRLAANWQTNAAQIKIGRALFEVELARTPAQQSQGLSDRAVLADNAGMLFVYYQDSWPSFWMKDMHFPLDLLWIDRHGSIVHITKNASLASYPDTFEPLQPIRYVLELNAGTADLFGFQIGDQITVVSDTIKE